jgi:ectoine hydroxylase-related dioxygenase (phytanoyl-CoA dioxygenase family)
MLLATESSLDLEAALAHFAAHGWARLGRVLADEGLAALGTRIDDLMHARVRHEGLFFQRDSASGRYEDLEFAKGWQGPSPEYRKIEKLELDPLFRAWMTNALFERIALYRAVLFTKSAAGGTALPWHQDGGRFWGVDRAPELQIWTALDDCPVEAGCVEVLDGSHRAGLATVEGGVIGNALLAAADAERRALPLPARAGESMLIHNHLWHRSGVNRTGKRRSAISFCYMSAATRCLRTKRTPRTFVRLFD